MLARQFQEGDRVRTTATRQRGRVLTVIPKSTESTGRPEVKPMFFGYNILFDDGSVATLYEGIEPDEDGG